LTTPFYIQLGGGQNANVQSKYVAASTPGKDSNGQTGDLATFVANKTAAAQFVIDSSTGILYEYNNHNGYTAGVVASNGLQIASWQSTKPSTYTNLNCYYDTSNNWIACQISGTFYLALTCNNDGNMYWGLSNPSYCQWLSLIPVPVSSK